MYSKTENRIDPEYYKLYYYKLFNEIKNISHCKLKDLTQLIDYGLMPTQDYAAGENSGIPFIRVTNILPSGEIDMSDIKYIPFDTPRIEQKRVKENDILMVQCGSTTGKVAIVPKEYENYLANSFSFIIRSNENIRQDFLFYVLGSRIVQMQIVRSQNIVSVRPNTSKPAVENLLIPLPILEQQTKIAEHISEIRQQAKHLQNEAKNILENAKREIEKIILGK
jgi:restriction endonuclease S subunit